MTGGLYRLGRVCVRRRWIVLAVWLVIFAVLAVWARSAGPDVNDNLTLPGSDSQAATALLEKRFPSQANGTNPVVLRAPSGAKITASKYKQPIDDTVSALKKDPDVRSATSPLSDSGSALLAKDKSICYIALNLKPSPSELSTDDAERIVALADPARHAGLDVGFGGYLGQKVSKPETHLSEVIGLGMAVIVLLITFGTVVAMGLPIATAVIGLVCGLSIITLLSHVAEVPTVAPTLATMIGLGVGIDYALFIVTRHLEQRRDGMDTRESVARASATSGGAVVFAGCTVMVALLSLAVVDIPLVTTLGYTSALVVAVAILGAITLLPALLGVVGDRIDRLRLPLPHGKADDRPHGWLRWGELVARHPLPAAIVALVVLVALALPALDLYLGQQDNGALPKSTDARQAFDGLTKGFGAGANGPLLISVDMSAKPAKPDQKNLNKLSSDEQDQKDKATKQANAQEQQVAASLEAQGVPPADAQSQAQAQVQPQLDQQIDKIEKQSKSKRKQLEQPATDPRLQDLKTAIKKTSGVKKVSEPLVNSDGKAAVLNATPTTAPSDRATADLVERLRDDTIPKATSGKDMTADVGGTTAGYVDLAAEISSRLIITILVVVGLSFLLLMLAFRSLVIPLTAGLMNLVSIGAAFGVVTAVFEKGWGASLVGLDGEVPIVSFVPLMMFAILFGLSMDYEVFLMTHIREAWLQNGDNRSAVITGVGTTGRVITSAALIMVSVFFAFIINGDPTVKQFGVGMGVAVAVDATFVRCLLVPAVMVLIGRANWWFPRVLDRIVPNFSIEGEDWFRERDAAAALAAAEKEETPSPVPTA
jgi:putative drug exporter of the RND superfamily